MARDDLDRIFPRPFELPMELVLEICRVAAILFAHDGQFRSVASILSLSKTIYNVTRPILYRRLVVSQSMNKQIVESIRSATVSPSLPPLLRGVYELHIYCPLSEKDVEAYAFALVPASLETVFVPFALIEALAIHPTFQPRVLSVQSTTLRSLRTLPKPRLASLTHVCSPFPWLYSSQFQWPAVYGADDMGLPHVFRDLTSLTHVMIFLVEPDSSRRHIQTTVILNCLRYILSLDRIRAVKIHAAGLFFAFRDDIDALVQELNDERIMCAYDGRPVANWDTYDTVIRLEDAFAGVNLWDSGQQFLPSP